MASKDVRESNRREVLTGKEMPIAGNGDKKTSSPREVGSAREGGGTPPVPVKARALNRSARRSRVLLLPPPSLLLLHRRRRLPPRRGGDWGMQEEDEFDMWVPRADKEMDEKCDGSGTVSIL